MYFDLSDGGPSHLDTQVCIVGAGAAGITLARALSLRGLDVVLLESGGIDYEAATSDLNAGFNVGEEYYELDHSRLRFFGGATAIWGGRCAELNPIDFEKRSWIPYSGWPLSYQELRPYYDRARQVFGIAAEPSIEALREAGLDLPDFDERVIRPRLWSFDQAFNRFTFGSSRDLRESSRCTIVTHATVTEVVASAEGRSVVSLKIVSPRGQSLSVTAKAYILAAGGIENPRILLASRSIVPNGLGNEHDQVGRYFMEHPHARGGRVVAADPWQLLNLFESKHRIGTQNYAALVTPGEELQAQEGLLNTSLTIAGRRPADAAEALPVRAYRHLKHDLAPSRSGRAMWMYTKKFTRMAQRVVDPFRPWLLHRMGVVDLALVVRAEQAPNPDSRITLADETDALGVPRVKLDWRTLQLDVHSVRGLVKALDREFSRLGIGRVEPADWLKDHRSGWVTDPLISMHPIGGYHHMGTTRMSLDPKTGVTDGDGRVHGIGNLYVAGSSLFTTSGWANPTLTIVALALRSADRIAQTL